LALTATGQVEARGAVTDVACFADTTDVAITALGGTPPYTFTPSATPAGAGTEQLGGSGVFGGVQPGDHTYTVVDVNNCPAAGSTVSVDLTVTGPTVVLSATATAIITPPSTTHIQCNGGDTSVTVTPLGGSAPYSIAADYAGLTVSVSAPHQFAGVPAGTHTYTVTDANGCITTASTTVTEPTAAVTATATPVPSAFLTDIGCTGGSTTVVVSPAGGTGGYTFAVSPATSTAGSDSAAPGTFIGVAAGTYTYTVTDANGCSISDVRVAVTEPIAAVTAIATSVVNAFQFNIDCFGDSTTVVVSPAGGTCGYTFAVSSLSSPTAGSESTTAGTFTGVTAGTHIYNVTDSNGCIIPASTSVTEPTAVTATATVTAVAAATHIAWMGGTTTVTVVPQGGTGSYTVTGPSSATVTAPSPFDFTVPAGSHTFSVVDEVGCPQTVAVTVTEPVCGVATADRRECIAVNCAVDCSGQQCGWKCIGANCADGCCGTECGSGCTGANCADDCNGIKCGADCLGAACAEECHGLECGSGCTGANCADDCTGDKCGAGCAGAVCAEGCDGVECGAGCAGARCAAGCVGFRCAAECTGDACAAGCVGVECAADCMTAGCATGCTDTLNGTAVTCDCVGGSCP
jgi:hypothetical protein